MRKGMLARCGLGAGLLICSIIPAERLGAAEGFLRGDVDLSSSLTVTDAIRILRLLFAGDAAGVPCEDSADVDDNGKLELTDAVSLLGFVFQAGATPPVPFPKCGADPTDDALGCASATECDPKFRYWDIDFDGGCVVWVIDRSGTMQDSGELNRAKQRAVETIADLSPDSEFAVLFSDKGILLFPSSGFPVKATAALKAVGTSFVQNAGGGSGSCDMPALLRALEIAGRSRANTRAVLYVGDGGGTCPGSDNEQDYLQQVIKTVTEANTAGIKIHSVQVIPAGKLQEAYMRELAEKNGGTYHAVQ